MGYRQITPIPPATEINIFLQASGKANLLAATLPTPTEELIADAKEYLALLGLNSIAVNSRKEAVAALLGLQKV